MRTWLILAAVMLAAHPAAAHAPIPGVGGFAGGLLHPVLVPAHAMSLIALGLFLGQQRERRIAALVFAMALAGSLLALALAVGETVAGEVLLADAALLGLLVAAAWTPPKLIAWLLAAIGGAALALDSPPDAVTIEEGNRMLLGTGLAACVVLALVVAAASLARKSWQQVGVRIAGSWIAASAILGLALDFAR